ncbi:hypothetical protein pkur_cds_209 [Pandoravirus kuranda]|uniref:Uncharacterized protein n=1 Tax=Pandoravirus kuranda TaxID=3019033 RepID=A0AA95J216_9VIRU|nr:hypothetical protein pkur_cds_209 [Pandoravirus kuranda]
MEIPREGRDSGGRPRRGARVRDPNRIELGLNLYIEGESKPAAYVGWCLPDGSKFCGNALSDQGAREDVFCNVHELCDLVGFDRDEGFDPWYFGRAYKRGSDQVDMLPVVEPGGRFDGRALAARSRDYRVVAKNMFKKEEAPAATTSCLNPYLVVGAGGSTPRAPVPAYVVGDSRKRAKSRKRADAAATRHQPAPAHLAAPPSSPAARTVTTTTTTVRAKKKRDREPRSTSYDDGARTGYGHAVPHAPVYEYATPLDMFAHWYDGKHDVLGCDESLDARTVWDTILPPTRPTKGKQWCRAYWEEKHAREYERACMTRSNWVTGADGKWERVDMPALDAVTSTGHTSGGATSGRNTTIGNAIDDGVDGNKNDDDQNDSDGGGDIAISDTDSDDDEDDDDEDAGQDGHKGKRRGGGDPDDKDLAAAFFSDTKGHVSDPRNVSYAMWDQPLLDRWFRRSARSSSHDDDPKIDAIVGRRWAFGTHMRYLCAWARPDTGVNARRLVRAASQNRGCSWNNIDIPTTWHAAAVLCTNPRYAAQVKAYDDALRACALSAVEAFLTRMEAAGHADILHALAVEARIALYGLGVLTRDRDGPPPQSVCVFPPGYMMSTRQELMAKAPQPNARAPIVRLIPRDPDADRAYNALMSASATRPVEQARPAAQPDAMEGVRTQRRADMATAARVRRIMRREWSRVERQHGLLAMVQADGQDQGDQDDEGTDDDDDDNDGASLARGARKPANPFLVVVERCMRDLEIAE